MDLQAGYWQVPLAPEDREKTAFVTADGLYQFKVLPFGLVSAPAAFQRLMDLVLAGLKWTSCLVYIDDVILFLKDPQEHLRRLEEVLICLAKAGLKLKLVKCSFAQAQLLVLGHIVSRWGVAPDPDKVRAVRDFPPPNSTDAISKQLKHVQSFVGLCSYYRRFIAEFSQKAKPLTDLNKKTVPFTWGPEQQLSFETLKRELADATLLSYPDPNLPMEIHPDACSFGIGAVLLQRIEGVEKPLAYASRLLTQSESNYSITELECLALVWSVKKFRTYIWGDGTGGSSTMSVTKNSTSTLSVFGQVPSGQDAATGTYTDNINIIIYF